MIAGDLTALNGRKMQIMHQKIHCRNSHIFMFAYVYLSTWFSTSLIYLFLIQIDILKAVEINVLWWQLPNLIFAVINVFIKLHFMGIYLKVRHKGSIWIKRISKEIRWKLKKSFDECVWHYIKLLSSVIMKYTYFSRY